MERYDHKAIEQKWQERWEANREHQTPDAASGKENYYLLVEFPYPSGNLHVGHWYAFAVPDIYARYKRMRGFNVLFPIGFDAFGLPAENAAIKHGADPKKWTYENIEHMRGQLQRMGNSFDWSREVVTADPSYYRWTQELFLKFYERGLAYRGTALVNWDPVDKTVLANEQVLSDGTAERSGAAVEKKELEQWFFKITDYADRLIDDLEDLPWPKEIKESQRNWIGRSEGAKIAFPLAGGGDAIEVFTTRPDTLFGATYLVLAPEHKALAKLQKAITNWDEVLRYIEVAGKKSEIERTAEGKEKTGVRLEGVTAINPGTKEEIPIFVADYVLAGYGTGAIMAVPAHDERDFEFAEKFGLHVQQVVAEGPSWEYKQHKFVYTGTTGVLVNSGKFDGLSGAEAKQKIAEAVGGTMTTTYKLRDWLLSRQRYWGCPIPIVYDPEGNPHPVPSEHLPWLLPEDVNFEPTGEPPLATSKELHERTERIFGKGWRPEYDTMDTFVDSSWYFLRYADAQNDAAFASPEKLKAWMPVDRYSGGAEHTTMHVLYSRFFHKALYDLGLVEGPEPYTERLNRGLILDEEGRKMSKRWGNVVDPDEQVERFGADTVKTYLAFIGPYNETGAHPWSTGGITGVRRFLDRVWKLSDKVVDTPAEEAIERLMHQTVQKAQDDIEAFKFNTVVSQLMILANAFEKLDRVPAVLFADFLRLLAPFAPHLAEELWEQLGRSGSVHGEPWPRYDPEKAKGDTITIAVQVDGKVRGRFEAAADIDENMAQKEALSLPEVQKRLGGKQPGRVIYVPGKLVNIVCE